MGNVWELFGKCLELSFPDYQLVNMVSWELFGNCLGNVWEMFGNLRGGLRGGGRKNHFPDNREMVLKNKKNKKKV